MVFVFGKFCLEFLTDISYNSVSVLKAPSFSIFVLYVIIFVYSFFFFSFFPLKGTKLRGTRWFYVKKKLGTQICVSEDMNLCGLDIHPHPQPTELGLDPFLVYSFFSYFISFPCFLIPFSICHVACNYIGRCLFKI